MECICWLLIRWRNSPSHCRHRLYKTHRKIAQQTGPSLGVRALLLLLQIEKFIGGGDARHRRRGWLLLAAFVGFCLLSRAGGSGWNSGRYIHMRATDRRPSLLGRLRSRRLRLLRCRALRCKSPGRWLSPGCNC